jgi:hypothetical protein
MAVRYIVVPTRLAPAAAAARRVAVPDALVQALAAQEDLQSVASDEALVVYQNTAWAPSRAVLPAAAEAASHSGAPAASQDAPLASATPVLPGQGPDRFSGPAPAQSDILVSSTDSARWHLSVGGRTARRRGAFGWAMAFAVPGAGGPASLRYHAPITGRLALALQLALWAVAAWILVGRARGTPPPLVVDAGAVDRQAEPFRAVRRAPRHEAEVPAVSGEEAWS